MTANAEASSVSGFSSWLGEFRALKRYPKPASPITSKVARERYDNMSTTTPCEVSGRLVDKGLAVVGVVGLAGGSRERKMANESTTVDFRPLSASAGDEGGVGISVVRRSTSRNSTALRWNNEYRLLMCAGVNAWFYQARISIQTLPHTTTTKWRSLDVCE